ncbi:uncharacterized protein LOC120274721 [Dioscorea cayenensis subsp. rotundata]|uniref:Uncharacterized protein LOC120274721 n=1 Tax=Dioscorea cayennensis subsp. rotundata TaxID=55577 RepID=A0AB40CBB2_DIOCR|nr:uncharacterized protein LOC120274721 [Dioscorea cayenensis subsp. rotundata]
MRAVKKRPGDRICDICGDAGYTENLVICFQCNTASEHSYCMQNGGFVGSESWFCGKCSASHGEHHDGKLNSKRKNLDISDVTSSQFKKTKVHDLDDLSFNIPQSGEFDNDAMCQPGSKKPFPSEDSSLEKRDVGKQQVATKSLCRSSFFNRKEPSKVKPLSAEEVVQLTSGAVGRTSTTRITSRRSFFSSANQSHVPSFRHVSHRTHQSKSTSSRPEENFHQRMKISFDSEVKHQHSNCMMTRENNGNESNDKEVRIENDRMPGEKVPAVLHGKQIMKQSPSTDVLSPRCNTSTCSRSVSAAPYLYKTSGLRKRQADNTLEPIKEEPLKNGDLIAVCSPAQNTKLADSECLNSRDIVDKRKKATSDEPTKGRVIKEG